MKETSIGSLEFLLILLFLLSLSIDLQPVFADRGLVTSPYTSLEESGQTAIVAWNGLEEVLILSTDVKSSKSALVLEILPLPSNPTKVEEGSFESFRKISDLINEKHRAKNYFLGGKDRAGEGGVEVVFHEEIGAHDVTIVRVDDLDHFIEWVAGFAEDKEVKLSFSSGFRDTVSDYLFREIRYFVFDVVETNEVTKSVNPLIYRFKTDFLYYPLEITAASNISEQTYSKVNLFLISKGVINSTVISNTNFSTRSGFNHFIDLSMEELYEISPELADLFEGDPLVMNAYYHGPLTHLKEDLIVGNGDLHMLTFPERFSLMLVERPIFSLLYFVSSHPFTSTTLLGKFVFIVWLLSFLLGVPVLIFYITRSIRNLVENWSFRSLTKGLLSYGLTITASIFLLFSGIMGVVILGVVSFTLVGIAAMIFVIFKLIKRRT